MSADSALPSHAGTPGSAAAPSVKPSVRMLAQYVKELTFDSPHAPRSLRASADQPNLQLDVGIAQAQIDRGVYEVVIRATGHATNKAGALYDFKISFAGLFEITGLTAEQTQPVLFINCPALIFPFVRQLVGDVTRNGGFSPVWLDAIDWGGLYTQRIEALKAQPAPTSIN